MSLVVVSGPATEPVTLAQAKTHLRVEHSDEDSLIDALIMAARERIEKELGRALATASYRLTLDQFEDCIELPRPPLLQAADVTAIKYLDTDGVEQTLVSSVYRVDADSEPARITLEYNQSWPSIRDVIAAVKVEYNAGYDSGASPIREIPKPLYQAMLLLIGHYYENRELLLTGVSGIELPKSVDWLIAPYKVHWF